MHKNTISRSQEAWCFSFQGMSEVFLKPSFKPSTTSQTTSAHAFSQKSGALLTEWGWRSLLFCHLQLPKRLTLVITHPIIKEFSSSVDFCQMVEPGMLCWRDKIHWVILAMLPFFRKHTSRTFIKQLNCETSWHITSSRNHEFIKRLKEIQRILKKITSYHMFPPIWWMLYLCS